VATTAQPSPTQSQPLHSSTARITLRAVSLWHLLSLDAPSVAALWTWFLADSNHVHLPATAILAMAIAVWMLYAADRLLDARRIESHAHSIPFHSDLHEKLEPRHLFHYRHRRAFRSILLLCSFTLAVLLPQLLPTAIRLYLILGGLLVGYFILIHAPATDRSSRAPHSAAPRVPHRIPKEFAVGVFFSAANFIPTIAREPALRPVLLPAALLFALLCSLNCLFIYSWEHPGATSFTHPATRLALRSLRGLTLAAIVLSLALAMFTQLSPRHLPPWPILTATALSGILLLALDHLNRSHHLSPTPLRASADLCLFTPLLLLPFLHA
jgi:hypothetical protein